MPMPSSGSLRTNLMNKIVFSAAARQDLFETSDYIASKLRNKSAARTLLKRIQTEVMTLAQFPESGTPLSFPGLNIVYRYLVCGNYLIFYHLCESTAHIDRILYGRRDYLSILFSEELFEESEG